MKNRLLLIIALLTSANLGYAISFDYAKYGFNIPAEQAKGLKVGDTFTITNVDPFAKESTETLKDVTGTVWAKKLSSVFPGGVKGPGRGIQTYKVVAIPAIAPALPPRPAKIAKIEEISAPTPQRAEIIKAQKAVIEKLPVKAPEKAVIRPAQPQTVEEFKFKIIEGLKPQTATVETVQKAIIETVQKPAIKPAAGKAPAVTPITLPTTQLPTVTTTVPFRKALTNQENIAVLQDVLTAVQKNDIQGIKSNFQKLPTGIPSKEFQDLIKSSGVGDKIDRAILTANPATQIAFGKASVKQRYPDFSEENISRVLLLALVEEKALSALKYLLEQEKVKDITGIALERAIEKDFYEAAELLVKNGAKITDKAQELAEDQIVFHKDERYKKLLEGKPTELLPTEQKKVITTTTPTDLTGILTGVDRQGLIAYMQIEQGITPETQIALGKKFLKEKYPSLSEEKILQNILIAYAQRFAQIGEAKALNALKSLSQRENVFFRKVNDITGEVLAKAIYDNFYEVAKFLVENGAKITQEARSAALGFTLPPFNDYRYEKLLAGK